MHQNLPELNVIVLSFLTRTIVQFFLDVCVHQGSSSVQMTSVSLQTECVMDTEIAPLEQMKKFVQVEVKRNDSTTMTFSIV